VEVTIIILILSFEVVIELFQWIFMFLAALRPLKRCFMVSFSCSAKSAARERLRAKAHLWAQGARTKKRVTQ